jgi:hypothetical protein
LPSFSRYSIFLGKRPSWHPFGVVAALFYLIVARGQPEPLLYKIAHGLKLVGGLPGGVMAVRRAGTRALL